MVASAGETYWDLAAISAMHFLKTCIADNIIEF